MFFADSHIHTSFSPDCRVSMEDMARSAVSKGADYICFTDHIDDCSVNDPISFPIYPFPYWKERGEAYLKLREEYKGVCDICLGGEVSSVNHIPDTAKHIYEDTDLDFIIGSLHSLRDTDDFHAMKYPDTEYCLDLTERYLREYIEIADMGFCDILGHVGYMKRYIVHSGIRYDMMVFEPLIRQLFEKIITKGIGIELNTSGMRDILGEPIPQKDILKLYRDMGGEIITVGSDSHTEKDICADFDTAYEILRAAGFKYICAFHQHKPDFIKI